MKLVAWNVETLAKRIDGLAEVHAALGTPDILCLQEIRIRAQDTAEVAALARALPGYTCHVSLPRDPKNVTFRGGRAYGVATFVRGEAKSAVPTWDREGRVVITRVGALTVINLYAVNGTAKTYYDEHGSPAGDRHAFKRRFQQQLFDVATELQPNVILAGDWNVSRSALDTHPRLRTEEPHALARKQLNERLASTGFVDIWRHLHPDERGYSWFNPRARSLDAARVDYIVLSPDLVPRVVSTTILPRQPWSDHAPLALEIAL